MSCEEEEGIGRKSRSPSGWGGKGSTLEGERGKVRAGRNGLSACQADACTVVIVVDSPARGESSIDYARSPAGVIS